MTKKEFYLRTIISMAGNPNYVSIIPLATKEDDAEEYDRILDKEALLEDAAAILNETEEAWSGVFDEDDAPEGTTKKLLYDLCAAVENMSCPDGKMDRLNDLLLDIRNSIDALNDTFAKLETDLDEE